MTKHIEKFELDVELWRIVSPSRDPEDDAFIVKDPLRTPEDWRFRRYADALAKFEERIENAKTNPPLIPRKR